MKNNMKKISVILVMIAAVIVTAVIAQNVRSDKNISGGPYSHLYYFTGRILSCNPETKDITFAIEDTEETDEKITLKDTLGYLRPPESATGTRGKVGYLKPLSEESIIMSWTPLE